MKKYLIILAVLLAIWISAPAFAGKYTIGFGWDANTQEICKGYRLYKSDQTGGPYAPVLDIEGRETIEVWHEFETPDGVETIQYFVVTALATLNRESGYSNEVNWTFDFRVMEPATELTAELQGDDIVFSWKQTSVERVKTWGLYRAEVSGGPYEKILDINYSGTPGAQYSETVSMPVPAGEKKTYYFVLVSVSTQGVSSVDSNQVTVVIDKQVISPVYNFRLKTGE